jgi:hypothetical protein
MKSALTTHRETQVSRLLRTYQPGERDWSERASAHIALFFVNQPLVAEQDYVEFVLLSCADLAWELRDEARGGKPGHARWSALSVTELFRRLAVQHEFFPQPELVVTFYEVLQIFLPWLAEQHLISRASWERLSAELALAKAPLVDDARRVLRARRRGEERQGCWYEVLKTLRA